MNNADDNRQDLSSMASLVVPETAPPPNPNLRWYVVHVYSSMEKAVERGLRENIRRAELDSYFGRILLPMEEVVEVRNGQRKTTERKFFPGYLLVEMELTDRTWHLVKHTNKVTGFIGGAQNKPVPISAAEMAKLMAQMQDVTHHPRHKTEFTVGESVRIKEGAFADFNGNVEEVNYEKSKLRVSVSIFGRATPVEIDFSSVEKL